MSQIDVSQVNTSANLNSGSDQNTLDIATMAAALTARNQNAILTVPQNNVNSLLKPSLKSQKNNEDKKLKKVSIKTEESEEPKKATKTIDEHFELVCNKYLQNKNNPSFNITFDLSYDENNKTLNVAYRKNYKVFTYEKSILSEGNQKLFDSMIEHVQKPQALPATHQSRSVPECKNSTETLKQVEQTSDCNTKQIYNLEQKLSQTNKNVDDITTKITNLEQKIQDLTDKVKVMKKPPAPESKSWLTTERLANATLIFLSCNYVYDKVKSFISPKEESVSFVFLVPPTQN